MKEELQRWLSWGWVMAGTVRSSTVTFLGIISLQSQMQSSCLSVMPCKLERAVLLCCTYMENTLHLAVISKRVLGGSTEINAENCSSDQVCNWDRKRTYMHYAMWAKKTAGFTQPHPSWIAPKKIRESLAVLSQKHITVLGMSHAIMDVQPCNESIFPSLTGSTHPSLLTLIVSSSLQNQSKPAI